MQDAASKLQHAPRQGFNHQRHLLKVEENSAVSMVSVIDVQVVDLKLQHAPRQGFNHQRHLLERVSRPCR